MNKAYVLQALDGIDLLLKEVRRQLAEEPDTVPAPIQNAPIQNTSIQNTALDTSSQSGGQKAMLCPECGSEMVLRTNREKGTRFWGCKTFPACRGTRDEDGLSRSEREALKFKQAEVKQETGFTFNRDKKPEPLPEPKPTFTPPFKTPTFNPFSKK